MRVPGTVLAASAAGIDVACGSDGVLRIAELQRAGGRRLAAVDFLRGHPVAGRRPARQRRMSAGDAVIAPQRAAAERVAAVLAGESLARRSTGHDVDLAPQARAAALDLTQGTLRHLGRLRALVALMAQRPIPERRVEALAARRPVPVVADPGRGPRDRRPCRPDVPSARRRRRERVHQCPAAPVPAGA